jgi:hypothetical protein
MFSPLHRFSTKQSLICFFTCLYLSSHDNDDDDDDFDDDFIYSIKVKTIF